MRTFNRSERYEAQIALLVAALLQLTLNAKLVVGSKYAIVGLEIFLIIAVGLLTPSKHTISSGLRRTFSLALIVVLSIANAASLVLVINALIHGTIIPGPQVLVAAMAIFLTNIIIFSIWYWEIDSPGLTGFQSHDKSPKFQFTQMTQPTNKDEAWEPTYFDYLYLSVTNATAFSPTDTMPMTHGAKALMGFQSLVSLLTIGLVAARAVNILA